jgi:multicomponent Na+:H+ antiporter subunit E
MTPKPATENPPPGRPPLSGWSVLLLFGLWLLLSGKTSAFHLGAGVVTVAFVVWQTCLLSPLEPLRAPHLRFPRLVPYACWLFWQMILSAVYVARVVLQPGRHLDPQLVEFHATQPSLLSGVILANSITLTPGTLTIDLQDDRFTVHALTTRTAQDTLTGDMARRVARLFTDDPPPAINIITPPGARAGA